MGKSWDSSGIAFDTEMWADIYKLLKPGAHLLAFSGSRTYHRMAVAIEDAGFEPRDMLVYCYGSGFPKSLNVGKAVDRLQGNEREVTDYIAPDGKKRWGGNSFSVGEEPDGRGINQATKGTSEWEGYGTALKPAIEPIILARKPISEKNIALNVLKHGTGGLNIDGTRVNFIDEKDKKLGQSARPSQAKTVFDNYTNKDPNYYDRSNREHVTGRFPANLIHDGSDEVEAVFPQTAPSKSSKRGARPRSPAMVGDRSYTENSDTPRGHNDNGGSASRYFYCAKASKSERNAGLEGFDTKVNGAYDGNVDTTKARKIGANPERQNIPTANGHPTVKPLSLTKYLATLIKPPTGGRLLVPFSGSGSEMIGALQAGWEYVEGVELTEEYIPIAEARIKYWLEQMGKEQISLL